MNCFSKIPFAGAGPWGDCAWAKPGVVIDKKGRGRPAAAESEQQRRTTESVIRIVGDAFPHHSRADQHRREEGEQGGWDKNAGHGGASESAYADH